MLQYLQFKDSRGKSILKQTLAPNDKLQHKPKIVAAIPCFNEERFIGSVVISTKKYVDKVVVIDDGSADATREVAAEAGAEVHQHFQNKGYGAAIRSAIEQGRRLGADVLVILDGDGQHDPKDIPRLVRPLINGEADVVVGSRFLGGTSKPPFFRRLGQSVITALTNVGSGQKVSDSQSGFRAYSSEALKKLNLTEDGMSVSSEIQFAIKKSGLRVIEVPINVSYLDKAKRNPVGHGLSVLSRVLVMFSLRQPLSLFGVPGLALLVSGLVLGTRVLTVYSATKELAVGMALGTILLCLAGLLALFAALMLQALKELLRGGTAQLLKEAKGYTSGEEHNEGGN
jgi:glycosyltransferase involved in cell wall biosynthesis